MHTSACRSIREHGGGPGEEVRRLRVLILEEWGASPDAHGDRLRLLRGWGSPVEASKRRSTLGSLFVAVTIDNG
jgi:hypothetical protein